jgi:hypothetical protein
MKKEQWEEKFCELTKGGSGYMEDVTDFIRKQKELSYQQGKEDGKARIIEMIETMELIGKTKEYEIALDDILSKLKT